MAKQTKSMTTDEALKIVLELAEQNIMSESDARYYSGSPEVKREQQRQIKAVAVVRVAFQVT